MTQANAPTHASDFDVLILGGGMVGLSLACALAPSIKNGLRVGMVDPYLPTKRSTPKRPSIPDGRATAVAFGSKALLEHIKVWPHMAAHACAIEHIQVSDQGRFGQTHLHAHEQDTPALGYIVENSAITQALLSTLPDEVVRIAGQQASKVAFGRERAHVTLDNDQTLNTRLVVMAAGGRSALAESLGIRYRHQPYHTQALVTSISVSQHHQHWAYERFTRAGPIAFLPLGTHNFAVAWTLPDAEIDAVMAMSDADIIARLQAQIGHRIGTITAMTERSRYPLALNVAHEQIRDRLVLLGNSAHSLHPVAGQGFNLALRDTLALVEHIQASPLDQLGRLPMLQAYEAQQRVDQHNTISVSDALPRLFSFDNRLIRAGRNTGLLAMASTPTLRRVFGRHAMGMGQRGANLKTPEDTQEVPHHAL